MAVQVVKQLIALTINFIYAIVTASVVLGEGRESYTPQQISTNIPSCFGVVGMISLTGVQVGDPRFYLRDVSKHQILYFVVGSKELLAVIFDLES